MSHENDSETDLKRRVDLGEAVSKKNPEVLPKPYYQDEYVTLYHGDCRELLPLMPKVDLVLTDPPYGIARFSKGFGNTRFKNYGAEKSGIAWDVTPASDLIHLVIASGHKTIMWGMNYLPIPRTEHFLVWSKHQPVDNFASAELAWTNINKTKVFDLSIFLHNRTKFGGHPTEKPIQLFRWCIGLADNAKTILDPFAGSGTTLRAAKDLGLSCIGIELEEKYCEVAANRMRQEVLGL